ncbi:MAG: hypothetical protein CBC38_07095 [Gammaproteobacteria bacterium TMED78]|nr:MAG: hypothetical protein CBC38_07095 [Gammaproteobacteria bacterium TMED78]|tara:strand:- start:1591 stop:2025 length:435 start_codon:yes stop_codon:yes gene_type:complete
MLKNINTKKIVPYSSIQMFELVDNIEDYPKFLPWCVKSFIHSRTNIEVEASLIVGFRGIDKTFSTKNILNKPKKIEIQLLEGPFRSLSGDWTFRDIVNSQSEIELNLSFESSVGPLNHVFENFFEQITKTQVLAFVKRANHLYG